MTTTIQDDILHAVTSPGRHSPARPATRLLSLTKVGEHRSRNQGVMVAREIASRVSEAVRAAANDLCRLGALSNEEANRIVWSVEDAAGATTHCLPGSDTVEGMRDASGDAVAGAALGRPVANLPEVDRVASTSRGVSLASLSWIDHDTEWGHLDRDCGVRHLSGAERDQLRRSCERLISLLAVDL